MGKYQINISNQEVDYLDSVKLIRPKINLPVTELSTGKVKFFPFIPVFDEIFADLIGVSGNNLYLDFCLKDENANIIISVYEFSIGFQNFTSLFEDAD